METVNARIDKFDVKIVLEVGGQKFATAKKILTKYPSTYFTGIISSDSMIRRSTVMILKFRSPWKWQVET